MLRRKRFQRVVRLSGAATAQAWPAVNVTSIPSQRFKRNFELALDMLYSSRRQDGVVGQEGPNMQLLVLLLIAACVSGYVFGRRGRPALGDVESWGDPDAQFDMTHLGYRSEDHAPY